MTAFTPTFMLLVLVVLVTGFYLSRAIKAHRAEEMDLTADELKTFNERFRFNRDRAGMPTQFQSICASSDRLRRTSVLGCLAVVAGIAFVIFKGPTP